MTDSNNELTFEQGMEELGGIVNRLEEGGIGVSQTVELCRRGKGLEQALRSELHTCEGELKRIESNEGLPEIRIVRRDDESDTGSADTGDFQATPAPPGGSDDDIPFRTNADARTFQWRGELADLTEAVKAMRGDVEAQLDALTA